MATDEPAVVVYPLRALLLGVSPAVRRLLGLRSDHAIDDLHAAIHLAMGWTDRAPHTFQIHNIDSAGARHRRSGVAAGRRRRRSGCLSASSSTSTDPLRSSHRCIGLAVRGAITALASHRPLLIIAHRKQNAAGSRRASVPAQPCQRSPGDRTPPSRNCSLSRPPSPPRS